MHCVCIYTALKVIGNNEIWGYLICNNKEHIRNVRISPFIRYMFSHKLDHNVI